MSIVDWQLLASDLERQLVHVSAELVHRSAELTGAFHQLVAYQAREQKLRDLTNALLRQIDIGTFVDDHGHSAKMLKATHDAMKFLALPQDDTALKERLKEEREKIASKFHAMVGGYDIAAARRAIVRAAVEIGKEMK